MKNIEDLFTKLKIAHGYYVSGDDAFKMRITNACDVLFNQLEDLGVARHFSESLLFYGADFVNSVTSIDGVKLVKKNDVASELDFRLIFGPDVCGLDDLELREFILARECGALVYKPIRRGSDKAAVRVLTYLKK